MTKQEEYQLKFERFKDSDGDMHFWCEHLGSSSLYEFYANFLINIDFSLSTHIIQEIQSAQNGQYFEPFQGPDSLVDEDEIEISPPNIILNNGEWSVSMNDFKELLEEWKDFVK